MTGSERRFSAMSFATASKQTEGGAWTAQAGDRGMSSGMKAKRLRVEGRGAPSRPPGDSADETGMIAQGPGPALSPGARAEGSRMAHASRPLTRNQTPWALHLALISHQSYDDGAVPSLFR